MQTFFIKNIRQSRRFDVCWPLKGAWSQTKKPWSNPSWPPFFKGRKNFPLCKGGSRGIWFYHNSITSIVTASFLYIWFEILVHEKVKLWESPGRAGSLPLIIKKLPPAKFIIWEAGGKVFCPYFPEIVYLLNFNICLSFLLSWEISLSFRYAFTA